MTRALAMLLLLALVGVAPDSAAASPSRPYMAPLLGENAKVPPLPPEYRSDDRGGIRFAYHPSARDRVRPLLEDAEPVRGELSALCGTALLGSVEVRVAYGSADHERVLPKEAPRGSDVVALGDVGVIVLSLHATPSASDVRAAFRRGMALMALDEAAGRTGLPRWFRIGFANQFARADQLSRARSLWWASMRQQLLAIADLDMNLGERSAGTIAEAQAADFVRYLMDDARRDAFPAMLSAVRNGAVFEDALHDAYQQDLLVLETAWREDLAKHKAFLPVLAAASTSWLLIALVVRWRRRRAPARPTDDAPELAAAGFSPPVGPKKKKKKQKLDVVTIAQQAKQSELARASTHQLPEPEVPKVSHNGRWHTLH